MKKKKESEKFVPLLSWVEPKHKEVVKKTAKKNKVTESLIIRQLISESLM